MSTPDENTLSPEAARRALNAARQSTRRTDTLAERAVETFGKARALGERNGFTEGVKALLRGSAA